MTMCGPEAVGGLGAVASIAGAFGQSNTERAQADLVRKQGEATAKTQLAAAQSNAAFGNYEAGVTKEFNTAQGLLQQKGAYVQADALDASASIADYNEWLSYKGGEVVVNRGADALSAVKRQGKAYAASARAAASAAGLSTSGGSVAAVLDDTEATLAMDTEALRLNTAREKWSFDVQGINYRNEAAMQRAAALQARWSGDASLAMAIYAGDIGVTSAKYAGELGVNMAQYSGKITTDLANYSGDIMNQASDLKLLSSITTASSKLYDVVGKTGSTSTKTTSAWDSMGGYKFVPYTPKYTPSYRR